MEIPVTIYIEEVWLDMLDACDDLKDTLGEDMAQEVKSKIANPDDERKLRNICRGISEAWGRVKYLCQRYLTAGNTTADNRLESIYHFTGDGKKVWEELKMTLDIPDFNTGVTDALVSSLHQYMVEKVLENFLRRIHPEASAAYAAQCDEEEETIIGYLNTRTAYRYRRALYY